MDFPVPGEKRTIDLARWSGREETIAYWGNLDIDVQAKFANRFKRLAIDGSLPRPKYIRLIGDEIHEIKIPGHMRAAAFEVLDEKHWYITHFFKTGHKSSSIKKAKKKAKIARNEHNSGDFDAPREQSDA